VGVAEPIKAHTADKTAQTAEVAASGSSFYAAMRVLPRAQREGMYEIYSFCRHVDDIADSDGPRTGRLEALEQWRTDIDALYAVPDARATDIGRAAPQSVAPHLAKLARVIAQYSLEREDFIAVIDGMKMDVVATIVAPDIATLDLYCDRVASAVGRLSVKVFGLPEDDGRLLSHHLGRALQLTNILRDIDEDAAIGRVYLPREALLASGIDTLTPEAIRARVLDVTCTPLVAQAREHFDAARTVMARNPRRAVAAPAIMAHVYGAILDKLAARGFAPPREPVRVSKARLAVFALLRHLLFR
jgi:phytoene synthase